MATIRIGCLLFNSSIFTIIFFNNISWLQSIPIMSVDWFCQNVCDIDYWSLVMSRLLVVGNESVWCQILLSCLLLQQIWWIHICGVAVLTILVQAHCRGDGCIIIDVAAVNWWHIYHISSEIITSNIILDYLSF